MSTELKISFRNEKQLSENLSLTPIFSLNTYFLIKKQALGGKTGVESGYSSKRPATCLLSYWVSFFAIFYYEAVERSPLVVHFNFFSTFDKKAISFCLSFDDNGSSGAKPSLSSPFNPRKSTMEAPG